MNIHRALVGDRRRHPAPHPGRGRGTEEPLAVEVERAIPYGEVDGAELLLDVHRPPTRDAPRPAVLLFHGGGLAFGDRAWMDEWATPLAEAGYVAFTISYRFLGDDGSNRWPTQLDDAQRAVRWVRANAADYGVDPERVCAFGHSSGAVLSAHLGTRETRDNADAALADQSSRVQCVVDIAGGAMDLTISRPGREHGQPPRRHPRGGPRRLRWTSRPSPTSTPTRPPSWCSTARPTAWPRSTTRARSPTPSMPPASRSCTRRSRASTTSTGTGRRPAPGRLRFWRPISTPRCRAAAGSSHRPGLAGRFRNDWTRRSRHML